MTSIRNLSDDLLEEILSWLSVDSLIRMKCVDKYWYRLVSSLIKSKQFVAKHLKNSKSRPVSRLLLSSVTVFQGNIKNEDMLLRILHKGNDVDDPLETAYRCLDSTYRESNALSIGWGYHCDGIICTPFRYKKAAVALYNPALRNMRLIGGSCFCHEESGSFIKHQRVGFGHDPIAKVYKIIRIVGLDYHMADWGAEIHTVGDNFWRKLHKVDPMVSRIELMQLDPEGLYCDGFYYWSVYNSELLEPQMLLSFDMHDEIFQTIPLPFPSDKHKARVKPALWNNHSRVAVFRCVEFGNMVGTIEMWVVHRDNSWTKHLTIRPASRRFYHPLLLWNNDEELLVFCRRIHDPKLASYNLRTGKIRRLQGVVNQMGLPTWLRVFPFVHSLVSFD